MKKGSDLASYSSGLIETGFSRIPRIEADAQETLSYRGSTDEHHKLLNISGQILRLLVQDPRIKDAASPTLVHADFHKRNIYVSPTDPTEVTGFIDWKSTSIEPAFVYANESPDFAKLPDKDVLDEDDGKPKTDQQKQQEKDVLICHQTYDVCMKGLVPD